MILNQSLKTCSLPATILGAVSLLCAAPSRGGEPVDWGKAPKEPVHENLWDPHRPDSHAPISVMAEHTHEAGEMMFSYRYMSMDMGDYRDGTTDLSSQDIFNRGFMVAPTGMKMEMHMLGMMYAPTDELTLMAMTSYHFREMDHLTRPGSMPRMMRGETFIEETEGWGDLSLSALYKVFDQNNQRVHFHFGFSAPTGELTERLYPMHPSTGTWDLLPGVTWLWQDGLLSGGAQLTGRIHLGENDLDFTYGDRIQGTSWLAYQLSDSLSVSGRLSLENAGDIEGEDRRYRNAPRMAPPMDPANHGGTWFEGGLGLNYYIRDGVLKGHRFAVEGILPLAQDLNGPQMQRDWSIIAGWQKAF